MSTTVDETAADVRPKCPSCQSYAVAYGPTTGQVTCMNPACRKVGYTFWPNGDEMKPYQPEASIYCPCCGRPR